MKVQLTELVDSSADPVAARTVLERLDGQIGQEIETSSELATAVVAVAAASRSLSRLVETDRSSLTVLAELDHRPEMPTLDDAGALDSLVAWKELEYLRIATRDLLGLDELEDTTALLADLAGDVLRSVVSLAGADDMAIIAMGKLGGCELNYASDIDVLFVGGDQRRARAAMKLARRFFRVDANLRPEGRNGPLTRSPDSYIAYWDRWASPWEFQALLKARPVAGDRALGETWSKAAEHALWDRPITNDDLRFLRGMKARTEAEVITSGTADFELKRGPGGLRDIEFSVQLLQLVHGRVDIALRSPNNLTALLELADGGYVDADDADGLRAAYRFLRRAEHVLQLDEGEQTHTLPAQRDKRRRVARVLGYRGTPEAGPTHAFDRDLLRHRNVVRSAHERLYFRPLMAALAGAGRLSPATAEAALATFGFAEADRVRQAVNELTRGLTRSSTMMQQLLPLLLNWLSETPDPDSGLLGLRKLATGELRTRRLAEAFRENPEVARHLCILLGTSQLVADVLATNPDLIGRLPDPARLRTQVPGELISSARRSIGWRTEAVMPEADVLADRQQALRRWRLRHLVGVIARDVFAEDDIDQIGTDLSAIAQACVEVALEAVTPSVPLTVVALGRFAGHELAYASDLDIVFVHGGNDPAEHRQAQRDVAALIRFLAGGSPSQRIYAVDPDLRPEGRAGPLARSIDSYQTYFDRWALTWERQAIARAQPVTGDEQLAAQFMDVVDRVVWGRPFTPEDEREVRRMKARIERERLPLREDPDFHLKLGRGALADIEWTVQLLQLRHGVRQPGTLAALAALTAAGLVPEDDARTLTEAYRFCERTRNRWWLVRPGSATGDALPQHGKEAAKLATSLGTTTAELRDEYRRTTRRARQVVERLFYGQEA